MDKDQEKFEAIMAELDAIEAVALEKIGDGLSVNAALEQAIAKVDPAGWAAVQ